MSETGSDATQDMTRRDAMGAGVSLGSALALLGAAMGGAMMTGRTAEAADVVDFGAAEKAHVQTVTAFIKEWEQPKPSADKILSYMTPDCIWRLGGQPPAAGQAAVRERIVKFTPDGTRYSLKILDTFARGNMVVHNRVDTILKAGAPDQQMPIGGVFVMKDGKIHEWYELLFPKT